MNFAPFPNRSRTGRRTDPSHPGFVLNDSTKRPDRGLLHPPRAKPGKEELLLGFLQNINAGVDKEPWFALRCLPKTTFCIFPSLPGRPGPAHARPGPGGRNFLRSELLRDMLAYPALYRLDVLHGKFGVMLGQPVKPA